jgi:hypothetical protein
MVILYIYSIFWRTKSMFNELQQSPKGTYHNDSGHMADYPAQCDWAGESQSKLRIVHDHFKHYLGVS